MRTDTELSDDVMEKLVAYVDHEEGRCAPPSIDDGVMVRALLDSSTAALAQVDDLDKLFEVCIEVAVPECLVAIFRANGH